MPKGVARDPSKDGRKRDTLEQICSNDGRSKYSIDFRRQVVWDYMIEGNAAKVGRIHGIEKSNISRWRQKEWWQELMQEATDLYEEQLRARMNKVVDTALKKTEERLENGDVIYDAKRGILVDRPVSAKDAATIAGIQYDKRRLSLNLPTSIGGSSSGRQIENLAEQFRKLAQNFEYKQIRDTNAIEGEVEEKKGS